MHGLRKTRRTDPPEMPANTMVTILYLPERAQLRTADMMQTARKAVGDRDSDVDMLGTIRARKVAR